MSLFFIAVFVIFFILLRFIRCITKWLIVLLREIYLLVLMKKKMMMNAQSEVRKKIGRFHIFLCVVNLQSRVILSALCRPKSTQPHDIF